MAAQPSFTQNKDLSSCSSCHKPYDKTRHQAKRLPCLHSYCKACLINLAGGRSHLTCPNCHKEVTLPGTGTIDSLPNNFLVQNMKDHQEVFNKDEVCCENCDEKDNQATGFCHDCSYFQCQNCMDNHRKMRTLHHHKLSTIDELKDKKKDPTMQPHCEKHPTQILTLFCREKECRVPACASCGHTTHRGHELIDIAAASAEIVSDLQHLASRVKKRNQVLTRKRAILEKAENILTTAYNLKQKEMYESVQLLYNLIDSRYNDAQSSLKHLHKTETDRLIETFKSIDSLAAQMTGACEFVNNACDMSHPTQLLNCHNQIQERLRELDTMLLPDTTSHNTDLVYTANHHAVQAQVQESLQHLYDTEWRARAGKSGSTSSLSLPSPTATESPVQASKKKPPANAPSIPKRRPRVDPAQCTVQLKQPSARRWYYQGIVQGFDYQGNALETGGAEVEASLDDGVALDVQDNDNGTYTFDYLDNKFGNTIHVEINGMPMTGNPFKG